MKRKAQLKSELADKLKDLEVKYDALKLENKQNLCIIKALQSKLRISEGFDKVSVSVQTERVFSCHKCNFEVDDVYEFDMHRWTDHEDDDELDSRSMDEEKREVSHHRSERDTNDFECNFCDDNFLNQKVSDGTQED